MSPFVHTLRGTASYVSVAKSLGAVMIHAESRDATYWYDESVSGFDGSLVNAPAWNASGGPGVGLAGFFTFDGVDQHISVGDQAALRFQTAYSLVWWSRTDGTQVTYNWNQVIGKGEEGYAVRMDSTDSDAYVLTNHTEPVENGAGQAYTVADYAYALRGEWVMWMARWSGTALELWRIDNATGSAVMAAEEPLAANADTVPDANASAFIYAAQDDSIYGSGLRRWWKGDIAGGVTFDKALTTSQFESLYDAATSTAPSPVAKGYADEAKSQGALMVHNQVVSGATWADESGNGLDGSAVGATWVASGGPGANVAGYWSFDGTDDYITVGAQAALDFTGAHSMVWWERTDGNNQLLWAQIIGKGQDSSYRARQYSGSEAQRDYQVDGIGNTTTSNIITANTWQMFMARYTGSALELWEMVNGTPSLRASVSGSATIITEPTAHFAYGARDDRNGDGVWNRFWRGHLAGAAVYGFSLSTSDFQALYDATGAT